MSSLPPGWGNRTNQMSEEDIKRGGVAATKFASKQNQLQQSVYSDDDGAAGGVPSYKSSDDVRQLYLKRIEAEEQAAAAANVSQSTGASERTAEKGASILPSGWEDRQKAREVEAKQYGVFGRKKEGGPPPPPPSAPAPQKDGEKQATASPLSAEEALVRVATHTLDSMAMALESNTVTLSGEDRAAFAEAMKRAMTAISRCR